MANPKIPIFHNSDGDGLLPTSLVGRSALNLLRDRIDQEGIEPTKQEPEPDWGLMRLSFQREHRLNEAQSDELTRALERLWLLPFRRYDACSSPVIFYFTQLPAIRKRFASVKDKDGLMLINGFSMLVKLMLQGISLFPGEPHYIAQQLMNAIISPSQALRLRFLTIARFF